MNNLTGKTAIITGSARGIGKGIAKSFVDSGANVVIVDIIPEVIEKTVSSLQNDKSKVIGYKCDITDANEVSAMVKNAVKEFGKIDILINNAGITKDNLLMRIKPADWQAVIDVNLTGTFLCSQKVSRVMMKQKYGKIINISSVIGIIGNPGQANYAASKGGIISFTKSIAKELALRNINVNAIAPGFIRTDMTDKLPEEVKKNYLKMIPMQKFGTPEDVAKLALFLASEQSSYITGQTISIDGGMI
ncbi:MAG: 3-oxoacyl-[acyl-carrier-protein] reductase [Candidatus Cloacimonadota bacterium]|nr:3-oxoacyl-[acyl-carrier-protein] reductase [Candidatus Cloacimonadota bacterium]